MNAPERSLGVTGASGQLGKAVLQRLRQERPQGARVTGFTRSDATHHQIMGLADMTAIADFAAPAIELEHSFFGIDTILLVSIEGEDDWRERVQADAVRAAARAGVRRIVYTSFFDVAPDSPSRVAKVHRCTEEAIAATDCHWTFLRNGPYLDNAVLRIAHAARHGGVFRMAAGDARLPFISRDDLAFAAASSLANDAEANRAFRLGGPQLLSFHELAALVGAKLNMPVRYEAIEDDAYQAELQAAGLPPEMVARRLAYVRAMREGFMTALSPDFESLTGRPPQTASAAIAAMDLSAEKPMH